MNKIDEIILKRDTTQENRRLYCLVLFDYYLDLYDKLVEQRFSNLKHHGINNKAMINFLFVCLHSVEDSYGLFEMFRHFKIGCGWSHRIIDVSQPDVERLFAMMPGYRLTGHKWEKKSPQQRSRIWESLNGQPVADFIKDSSVSQYAVMIDRGINELISLMPDDCLADLTLRRQAQTDWIKWMDLTGRFNLTQNTANGIKSRNLNICQNFTIEELSADKQLLLKGL